MKRFIGSWEGDCFMCTPPSLLDRECIVLWRGFIANADEIQAEARRRSEGPVDEHEPTMFERAYRWWGARLTSHVLGQYALVIADLINHQLLISNDSLGIVPVFYHHNGSRISVASHLNDLLRLDGLPRLDEEYIAEYLALGYPAGRRTPYAGYHRLLPGSTIVFNRNGRNERQPYNSDGECTEVPHGDILDRTDQFRSLLTNAVASAARPGSGRVWAELSGGLDSSSVVCIASNLNVPLEVASIVYSKSKQADESYWMRQTVDAYDISWNRLDGDQFSPFSEVPTRFFAEPSTLPLVSGLDLAYQEMMRENSVDVVLTGLGGDLVLAGDAPEPFHLANYVSRLQIQKTLSALRAWKGGSHEQRSSFYWLWRFAVKPAWRYRIGRVISDRTENSVPSWYDRDYVSRMCLEARARERRAPRASSPQNQAFLDTLRDLSLLISTSRDQYTHDFAYRHPLLYRPLVEYMLSLPWTERVSPAEDRILQRLSLRGILPELIRTRQGKGGPQQAFENGLRGSKAWLDLLLQRSKVVEQGYVNAERWPQAVAQARFGRTQSLRHFYAVIGLEYWLRSLDTSESSLGPPIALDTLACYP